MKKPKVIEEKKTIMQTEILLQGGVESFSDYEIRLNDTLRRRQLTNKYRSMAVAIPTAAADGRLCCVIHFEIEILVRYTGSKNGERVYLENKI